MREAHFVEGPGETPIVLLRHLVSGETCFELFMNQWELAASMSGLAGAHPPGLHIFWDGNNILGGGEQAAKDQGEPGYPRLRIYFQNLLDIVRNGRHPVEAWMSGNVPPPEDEVWSYAASLGINLSLSRRTADGREGLLDQVLREKMLATEFDYPEKGTIALLTGDGAGVERNEGFFANLKRLRARGWDIELFSWDLQAHRKMREWARSEGKYISLDRFYQYVTFVNPEPTVGSPGRIVRRLGPFPYY